MKLRLTFLSVLLPLILGSTAHTANEWKIYRYPLYGFAEEYPTQPPAVEQNSGR
jgi:hypothetical protein